MIFSAPLLRNRDDRRTRQLPGNFAKAETVAAGTEIRRILFLLGSERFLFEHGFGLAERLDESVDDLDAALAVDVEDDLLALVEVAGHERRRG